MRAQTTTQLFNQLHQSGYSKADLTLIVRALDLAIRIFSCRYCESGKTQIDHVIGTASILSSLRAPAAVVAAGLIHNAYNAGDFGVVKRRISKTARRRVENAVGKAAEARVYGFAVRPWGSQSIRHTHASLEQLGPVDRDVVLIRLAELLDHHSDLEGLYYHRGVEACRRFVGENGPLMLEIARGLGHSSLAAALAEAFAESATADASQVFFPVRPRQSEFVVPDTYRRRARIVVGSALLGSVGKLRARLGVRTRFRSLIAHVRRLSSGPNGTATTALSTKPPFRDPTRDGIEARSMYPIEQVPVTHGYAQTCPQLLRQLEGEGYSEADLNLIVNTYELAKPLFAGFYQPSRKTLIAHHVGTASILASLHSCIELVAAGLIHAAYEHGDFGSGIEGMTDSHREQVRSASGPTVEEYLARYQALAWNSESVAKIAASAADLGAIERGIILMRIAAELEGLLDLDPLYAPHGADRVRERWQMGMMAVPVVEALGVPSLGAELRRMLDEISSGDIAEELRSEHGSSSVFRIVPDSYRSRHNVRRGSDEAPSQSS